MAGRPEWSRSAQVHFEAIVMAVAPMNSSSQANPGELLRGFYYSLAVMNVLPALANFHVFHAEEAGQGFPFSGGFCLFNRRNWQWHAS
jgi:hypothetical protein